MTNKLVEAMDRVRLKSVADLVTSKKANEKVPEWISPSLNEASLADLGKSLSWRSLSEVMNSSGFDNPIEEEEEGADEISDSERMISPVRPGSSPPRFASGRRFGPPKWRATLPRREAHDGR